MKNSILSLGSCIFFVYFSIILLFTSAFSYQRDRIRIVGSTTLYPFISAAAENFARNEDIKTPIVEATGTGSGLKLFCASSSLKYPDIVNASRKIKESELKICYQNGVSNIEEIMIGFDGVVIARSKNSVPFNLSINEFRLAIAKYIVENGKLVLNNNHYWSDIDKRLPKSKIEIYGPSHGSGTRDTLVDVILAKNCGYSLLDNKDLSEEEFRASCALIREDGHFIESSENDNLIISKIVSNLNALGIISYNYLESNANRIIALKINNIYPTPKTIVNDSYPISRPLYLYLNRDHEEFLPELKDFISTIRSEKYVGRKGILVRNGLITQRSVQ
jgi:phosphate transport system substrate-binding protein